MSIYQKALDFEDSDLTIVTKVMTTPFRFGSITAEGDYVKSVEEKPDLTFESLSGIYVLKPALFDIIPFNQFFGIDTLITRMLADNRNITKP